MPCTLPLLDRWFGADEKETISNAMGMEIKVRKKIDGLRNKLYDAIERGQKVISSAFYFELYIRENFGDEYFSGEENSYSEKRKLIKKIRKDVKRLCPALMNASVIIQLNKARDQLDQLIGCWDQAYEIVGRLDDYREIRQELETLRSEVDGLIQEFNSWKPEEYHLITTESFLVCRCGGIITTMEAAGDEGDGLGGIFSKVFSPKIIDWNNAYTAFSSMKSLIYVSHDSYVENIQITVFTDTHAHVARGTLNAKGELQSGINFYLYERNDYIEGNLGRGLEWQEEKGIYVRSLVHQGDNRDVGKEAKNGTDFKGSIPFSVQ